ncbi:unnamed protein product [Rotaria sp. Silwood2]|nr:unnamed protein product [Rotaria sp. Silwood2]CAF4579819.1 unnamed protein product [Rotaria sp. Silwood2]
MYQETAIMDSDADESDNDGFVGDDEIIDSGPFPDECQDEIIGIESFNKCFEWRYDACPAFFMGSLRDACQEAFKSTVIQEVPSHLL